MGAPTMTMQVWVTAAQIQALRDGMPVLVEDNMFAEVLLYTAGTRLIRHAQLRAPRVMLVASDLDLIDIDPAGLLATAEGVRDVGWQIRRSQ